jgi:hypothetical protein
MWGHGVDDGVVALYGRLCLVELSCMGVGFGRYGDLVIDSFSGQAWCFFCCMVFGQFSL